MNFGIVHVGVFQHADEGGCFDGVELALALTKIGLGRSLNAIRSIEIVKLVEVHGEDFLLGVALIELDGDDPLFKLRAHQLKCAIPAGLSPQIGALEQEFSQLLIDRASPTCTALAEYEGFEEHSPQTEKVNA